MTQFKCMICGKVDELDKAIHDSKIGLICEECDRKTSYTSEDICVCCGEVIPKGRQVCAICETKNIGDAIARGIIDGVNDPRTDDRLYIDDIDFSSINKLLSIHKIIDDAMEKRDRTVSIYIGEAGVSVNVYPVDHDKVYWKADPDGLICTNCGFQDQSYRKHTYCPGCGELMHGIR